jgi:hypothetical protein
MVGRIWLLDSRDFCSSFVDILIPIFSFFLISFFQSMASLRGWIISLLCLGNLKWTVNKIQRDSSFHSMSLQNISMDSLFSVEISLRMKTKREQEVNLLLSFFGGNLSMETSWSMFGSRNEILE